MLGEVDSRSSMFHYFSIEFPQTTQQTCIVHHIRPSKLIHRPTPLKNHCHAIVDEMVWQKHKVYQAEAKDYCRSAVGPGGMSMELCGTGWAYASHKERKALAEALKPIYQAVSAETA